MPPPVSSHSTRIDAAALDDYQPYHAARADLLGRAGKPGDAVAAYDRAIELTTNPTERRFLATSAAGSFGPSRQRAFGSMVERCRSTTRNSTYWTNRRAGR